MTYAVTIKSTDGRSKTYVCAGPCDQVALIYAGKVVEVEADRDDVDATIHVTRDGADFGPIVTVGDMLGRKPRLSA